MGGGEDRRRGGGGADGGRGLLGPPGGGLSSVLFLHKEARRAATRAPTPPNPAPAPTRSTAPLKKPTRVRGAGVGWVSGGGPFCRPREGDRTRCSCTKGEHRRAAPAGPPPPTP